jgi:thiamine biosynthesis lipoprotein
MEADAFATAVTVLGPQAGYDWAAERGLSVLIIERTNDGFHDRTTPQWSAADEKQ